MAILRHALFGSSVAWIFGLVPLPTSTMLGRVDAYNLSDAGLHEPRSPPTCSGVSSLWPIDGILQFQPSMPLGLANGVVAPAAIGFPSWLHALVFGVGIWNSHPVAFAVGTAWVQVGIGRLLLGRERRSRPTGVRDFGRLASMIWLMGNSAGRIFSPTSSVLSGGTGRSSSTSRPARGSWSVTRGSPSTSRA